MVDTIAFVEYPFNPSMHTYITDGNASPIQFAKLYDMFFNTIIRFVTFAAGAVRTIFSTKVGSISETVDGGMIS